MTLELTPTIFRPPRPPFSKPSPGTPINWAHALSKGLVHSYPLNEGRGDYIKDYAWPQGFFDLQLNDPNVQVPPAWTTYDKVNALFWAHDYRAGPGTTTYFKNPRNTGATNADFKRLPRIDYSRGVTLHIWVAWNLLSFGGAGFFPAQVEVFDGTASLLTVGTVTAAGNADISITVTDVGGNSRVYQPNRQIWTAVEMVPNQFIVTVMPQGTVEAYFPDSAWNYSANFPYDLGDELNSLITHTWPGVGTVNSQNLFEGYIYCLNIWNRPLGEHEAKRLLRNPLQMYNINEAEFRTVVTIVEPPPTGNGPGDDDDPDDPDTCVDAI